MSNVVLSAPDVNDISWRLDLDNLPHTFGYDGNGNLITDTVVFNGITFIQTFTWVGSNLTAQSRFIPQ